MALRIRELPVHRQILDEARRMCDDRWRFRLDDLVKRPALAHLNSNTVRTQVTSYCCVDAEQHHAHRQPYFNRVGYGLYEIRPKYRPSRQSTPTVEKPAPASAWIHAIIRESEQMYVAECLEVPVVTQGRSLDETLANLREAVALHLEGEDLEQLGLAPNPRISAVVETALSA